MFPVARDIEVLYLYGQPHFSALFDWLEQRPLARAVILEQRHTEVHFLTQLLHNQQTNHPRVEICYLGDNWQQECAACAASYPSEKIAFVTDCTEQQPNWALIEQIRHTLELESYAWHRFARQSLYAADFYRNCMANLPFLSHSFQIADWQGRFTNIPAIICGAGPSLASLQPVLKPLENRAILIGGGSALSALDHLHVCAHLGIAVDPNPTALTAVSGNVQRRIPLLYASRLYPEVLKHFDGPYGYIRSQSGGRLEQWLEEQLGIAGALIGADLGEKASSVTLLAAAVAQFLGCNPIIFAGVDLAFADGKQYAAGVRTPENHRRLAVQQDHKVVSTTLDWIMEAEALSQFAKNHPSTRFWNVSAGLAIKNIAQGNLAEIAASWPVQKMDFSFHIAPTHDIRPKLKQLHNSLERCRELVIHMQQHRDAQAIVAQLDLEQELAYPILLEEILFAHRLCWPGQEEQALCHLIKSIDIYLSYIV